MPTTRYDTRTERLAADAIRKLKRRVRILEIKLRLARCDAREAIIGSGPALLAVFGERSDALAELVQLNPTPHEAAL